MTSEVLIDDSKEFRDFLFNHPAFIGQHFSTYDVFLYLDHGVGSMFKYVLWSNPEKPNIFYITYTTFNVKHPADVINANIEVNYLKDDALVKSTAFYLGYLSHVSYYRTAGHWDDFTLRTKVQCSLFTITDIVRVLELRDSRELCRYYTREMSATLEPSRVSFTILPFNKFQTPCSVFCETKTKGKPSEQNTPWPLWKMAAFLVHETLPLETILEKVPPLLYPYVLQCNITSSDIGHKGGIYKNEEDIEDVPRLMDQ